ncbi:NUDIX hydrolase [Paracoccus mutanolyticus]|uniref:NUDIX domain-containing protein n=1 Tax=Paracoccus mutanolyticus TaxID=1499308 RepID=UPI0016736827|nr:NUDIX domain-containing protein [Paracoccus mutanolyticus]
MTDPMPIRDAATVIVLDRNAAGGPSVLMGQRGAQAAFMPSKYVFPGGAVDPEDARVRFAMPLDARTRRLLAAEPRDGAPITPEALAAAALRELAEETGLMTGTPGPAPQGWDHYARAWLAPDPAALIYLFRAITPPGRTRTD